MVRYYAYNPHDTKPKLVEISEADHLKAKSEPDRWFISFGNCVLECEEELQISQQAVSKRYRSAIKKLKALLADLE